MPLERGDTIQDRIEHEKRLKRWQRDWKFALTVTGNPDRRDLFNTLT